MEQEIKDLQEWLNQHPGTGKGYAILKALAVKSLKRFGPDTTDEDRQFPAEEVAIAAGWNREGLPTKWLGFGKTAGTFWEAWKRDMAIAARENGKTLLAKPMYVAGGGAGNTSLLYFEKVMVADVLGAEDTVTLAASDEATQSPGNQSIVAGESQPAARQAAVTVVHYDRKLPEQMKLGIRGRLFFRRGQLSKGTWRFWLLLIATTSPIVVGSGSHLLCDGIHVQASTIRQRRPMDGDFHWFHRLVRVPIHCSAMAPPR